MIAYFLNGKCETIRSVILIGCFISVYCVDLENKTFRCRNGTYISDKLVGNGRIDCFNDGIDERFVNCDLANDTVRNLEENCRHLEFEDKGFKFIKNGCKSVTGHCNTIKDCSGGNDIDEHDCGDEVNVEECSLSKRKYLCADGLRCLDVIYTCDGFCNCFDCSDEKNSCSQDEYLNYSTNASSHTTCFKTPNGPLCCSEYNSLCRECDSNSISVCDHNCVQFAGETGCFCDENYTGVPGTNNVKCRPSNSVAKGKLLLYSTSHVINATNLYTNARLTVKKITPWTNSSSSFYISALSAFHNYVYYATREAQPFFHEVRSTGGFNNRAMSISSIYKTSLFSNETYEIMKFSTADVEISSVAVDWVTGNIYCTSLQFLLVCSNNGSTFKELKSDHTEFINLASRFGLMFWFRPELSTRNGYLMKSSMDGSEEKTLVVFDLKIDMVTVDESSLRIYWHCVSCAKIESVNFNGDKKNVVPLSFFISGPGIYFEEEVFFIHVGSKILSIDKGNKTASLRHPLPKELLYRNRSKNVDEENLRNVYVYNPLLQHTTVQNPCPASCNGLCLTRPSLSKGVLNYTCWYNETKNSVDGISDVSYENWFTITKIVIIFASLLTVSILVGIALHIRAYKLNTRRNKPPNETETSAALMDFTTHEK